MKKFFALCTLLLSLSALAQERVVLNSSQVRVNASAAVLVRTAQTPDVVKVTFMVPMSGSVCQAYSTRYVRVTSSMHCGTVRRVSGYTTRTVCIRRNPHNNECLRTRTEKVPVYSSHPGTCTIPETYCSSYATVTNYEPDEVKFKFKKLPTLGGTEEDLISVRARQRSFDGENVVYDVNVIQSVIPYEVKDRGLFGSDKYVIQPK
jgi:hypothetical protein